MSKRKTKNYLAARDEHGNVIVVNTKTNMCLWFCSSVRFTIERLEIGGGVEACEVLHKCLNRGTRIFI